MTSRRRAEKAPKPSWPAPTLPIEGFVVGIDPGPSLCGWCILEYAAAWDVPRVLGGGHCGIDDLAKVIRSQRKSVALVACEGLMPYGNAAPGGSRAIQGTAFAMGRLAQEAARAHLPWSELPRREIIRELLGRYPGKSAPVSKALMQEVVAEILGLDGPVRPQHANDAVCAALAIVRRLEAAAEEVSA
jgi:Holliday junction resolvasome RuvABC endonuclease subunit